MKINSDTAIVRKHHKKNAGAYTKKRKEEENQFCHHFRKIPRKGYNLQNCWSSLLFNNICQITNTKKVTSTLR